MSNTIVVLSEDRLNAKLVEYTGDEDALTAPDNPDACYRYDTAHNYRKDADVSDSRVLRDINGVFVFISKMSALDYAVEYLEATSKRALEDNIAALRAQRKAMMPKPQRRRAAAKPSKRTPAPAAVAN